MPGRAQPADTQQTLSRTPSPRLPPSFSPQHRAVGSEAPSGRRHPLHTLVLVRIPHPVLQPRVALAGRMDGRLPAPGTKPSRRGMPP